ncbi:MAG: type II toxin-antitoxin system RelE/ParE family toxin [Chloroflexota bacterium]|jgi:mRNA-degrading endonuclease RelE of RelBE toxin-antitoxin system
MPKIDIPPHFILLYQALPASIRKKVDKTIALLAENPRHPSLQTKPIRGTNGIYEARVDLDYRLTYERLSGDTLLLRAVGRHDETIKNP